MASDVVAHRPAAGGGVVRIICAALIVVGLSSAPFASISRWVTREPPALETWPYVYSYWGAGLLGAGLFVLDVVGPMTARPIRCSARLLAVLAAPMALAGWVLASVGWTDSPTRTPQQAVLVGLVILTAIWFGYALTFWQQIVTLFVTLQGMTVVSVIASSGFTSGRLADDNSWMGLFNNPNTLSPVATLGVITAIGVIPLARLTWQRVLIGVCVAADMLAALKASSVTGWVAFGGGLAATVLLLLFRLLARRGVPVRHLRVVGLAVVAIAIALIQWALAVVEDLFGKGLSWTWRPEIWRFAVESVEDRWLTGFGWQSFWDDQRNVDALTARTASVIDSAHSTFLESLLFIGGIGLFLVVVVVITSVGWTWWEALGGHSWSMIWWASVATFCLLENVTESMITYHSIFWVLLVASGFAAARAARVAESSTRPSAEPATPPHGLVIDDVPTREDLGIAR